MKMSKREILFRGKRKDNGEWIYGVPITDEATNDAYIITSTAGASLKSEINNMCATGFRIIRNTVGQYTGLTDKNGMRLFEGDIVKQEFSKFRQSTNGICEFHDGSFGLKIKDLGIEKFLPFACICNATYEVIGNIHDNPELLKGD